LDGTHQAAGGVLEECTHVVKRLAGHDATLDKRLDSRNPERQAPKLPKRVVASPPQHDLSSRPDIGEPEPLDEAQQTPPERAIHAASGPQGVETGVKRPIESYRAWMLGVDGSRRTEVVFLEAEPSPRTDRRRHALQGHNRLREMHE
jgi:hypothetical protein